MDTLRGQNEVTRAQGRQEHGLIAHRRTVHQKFRGRGTKSLSRKLFSFFHLPVRIVDIVDPENFGDIGSGTVAVNQMAEFVGENFSVLMPRNVKGERLCREILGQRLKVRSTGLVEGYSSSSFCWAIPC